MVFSHRSNLHRTLDINVKSTAFMLAHAMPHLAQTKGSVAIVNSMMGKFPQIGTIRD